MTQEEKQLLLKDLCGRLPYGVKVNFRSNIEVLCEVHIYQSSQMVVGERRVLYDADMVKPYLRPMSSMTNEEWCEYCDSCAEDEKEVIITHKGYRIVPTTHKEHFFNIHHFDYRSLIENGLALEAPEGMYVTTAQKKEEIEIPKNLEEALSILNEMVSDEDKEYFKENGAISAHLSLGMWIRNNFGLWENSEFYEYLFEKGFTHPDDMSNYVIEEFIKTL